VEREKREGVSFLSSLRARGEGKERGNLLVSSWEEGEGESEVGCGRGGKEGKLGSSLKEKRRGNVVRLRSNKVGFAKRKIHLSRGGKKRDANTEKRTGARLWGEGEKGKGGLFLFPSWRKEEERKGLSASFSREGGRAGLHGERGKNSLSEEEGGKKRAVPHFPGYEMSRRAGEKRKREVDLLLSCRKKKSWPWPLHFAKKVDAWPAWKERGGKSGDVSLVGGKRKEKKKREKKGSARRRKTGEKRKQRGAAVEGRKGVSCC